MRGLPGLRPTRPGRCRINGFGARSHPLRDLTTTLFSPADRDRSTTPALLAVEEAASGEVVATAPPGLSPGAPPVTAGEKE